jgi:hypothetical protein
MAKDESLKGLQMAVEMADEELIKKYKAEAMKDGATPAEIEAIAGTVTATPVASAPTSISGDIFEFDMNQDEFDEVKSGLDRPVEGKYRVVIGIPDANEKPNSIKIPFTIKSPKRWEGFEDAEYAPKSKAGAFKLKNFGVACGVIPRVNPKTGKIGYQLADFYGKECYIVYQNETSTFIGSNGNEITATVAKPGKAEPVEVSDLGV